MADSICGEVEGDYSVVKVQLAGGGKEDKPVRPTKATPEKGRRILDIVLKHMMAWLEEYRVWPIEARGDQHRLPVPRDIRW